MFTVVNTCLCNMYILFFYLIHRYASSKFRFIKKKYLNAINFKRKKKISNLDELHINLLNISLLVDLQNILKHNKI